MLRLGCVPDGFGLSYTIALPKTSNTANKPLSVNEFRGISISPVVSKIFENAFWIVLQSSLKVMIVSLVSRKGWDVLMQFTQLKLQ